MGTANFNGDWIGFYHGHHDEVVRLAQDGDRIEAVKVTGDSNVPAGETTWRIMLDPGGRRGVGEGQIAEEEFRNPRFVPGVLRVEDDDHIEFTWTGLGTVQYRRDI